MEAPPESLRLPTRDEKKEGRWLEGIRRWMRAKINDQTVQHSAVKAEEEAQNARNGMLAQAILHTDGQATAERLQKGADPNHCHMGRPLLSWCVRFENKYMVELLLQYGADPNVPDEFCKFPLDYAETIQDPFVRHSIKTILLQAKATMRSTDTKQKIRNIFRRKK
jgi:hypothetical protein